MARLIAAAVLALAAVSCGGDAAAGVRTIELDIEHSKFVPDRIAVQAGETVRFVIRNGDPIDHEFIVGDEEVHRIHSVGRDSHHHGDVPGEVSVPAFEEGETTYVFDEPGILMFACHLPGHFEYGMHGEVRIR